MRQAADPLPSKGLVLLAEDDVDIRELLTIVLVANGFTVESSANGLEAWARLARPPRPTVILVDLVMPVMNGWELLELLRTDASLSALPVAVVSSSIDERVVGYVHFPKPVDIPALLSFLDSQPAAEVNRRASAVCVMKGPP